MSDRVELLVGTKKGAFILESDAARRDWAVRGPFCETWPIHHLVRAGSDGTLYAAGGNAWYGPSVWRSPLDIPSLAIVNSIDGLTGNGADWGLASCAARGVRGAREAQVKRTAPDRILITSPPLSRRHDGEAL